MAEEKVLHINGKVPSTDGKSLLDMVNFARLVTRCRVRSGATSSHESESAQRVVASAPTTSKQALRVFRAPHDEGRSRNTSIGRFRMCNTCSCCASVWPIRRHRLRRASLPVTRAIVPNRPRLIRSILHARETNHAQRRTADPFHPVARGSGIVSAAKTHCRLHVVDVERPQRAARTTSPNVFARVGVWRSVQSRHSRRIPA